MTLLALLWMSLPAMAAQINATQAIQIACAEAARIGFEFPGRCADEFTAPDEENEQSYTFFGQDTDGNCGIAISVDKQTGEAHAEIDCA